MITLIDQHFCHCVSLVSECVLTMMRWTDWARQRFHINQYELSRNIAQRFMFVNLVHEPRVFAMRLRPVAADK